MTAHADTFSDTAIGYRYGIKFAEPSNNNAISKDIINLNHVSGYKDGTNFINADILLPDSKDLLAPVRATALNKFTSSTATPKSWKNSPARLTSLAQCAAWA